MSALQFLNKKSWHTRTIHNNEKVWLKEQEAAKEQKRIDELQKQLAEERKIAEIQRLELESGRLDPAEALKRRRLNWMYEHAAPTNSHEKKAHDEKEKDDVLMGKKDAPLQTTEKEMSEKLALVDMEAKLREDPMFEVELRRTRAVKLHIASNSGKKDAKYTSDELEAKRIRKEERRRVREERRIRREERQLCRKERSLDFHHSTFGKEVDASGPLGDNGRELQNTDVDGKRPNRYGLHIPAGGSGVAVSTEFVPRRRGGSKDAGAGHRARPSSPTTSRGSEGSHSERTGRPPLSPTLRAKAEERRRILYDMREDALNLETERRRRAERHVKDANREREAMNDRHRKRKSRLRVGEEEPMVEFARQTIARGASTAEMIQQRRGRMSADVNACY